MNLPKIWDYIKKDELTEDEYNLIVLLSKIESRYMVYKQYLCVKSFDYTVRDMDDIYLDGLSYTNIRLTEDSFHKLVEEEYISTERWAVREYTSVELSEDGFTYNKEENKLYVNGQEVKDPYHFSYDLDLHPRLMEQVLLFDEAMCSYLDAVFNDAIYVYLNSSPSTIDQFKTRYKDLYNNADSIVDIDRYIDAVNHLITGEINNIHQLFKFLPEKEKEV